MAISGNMFVDADLDSVYNLRSIWLTSDQCKSGVSDPVNGVLDVFITRLYGRTSYTYRSPKI